VYNASFPTRLNLLAADTLGFAYESVLHEVSHALNRTSVYTPEDLAIEMISKLAPNRKDVIVDPSAGTGTMLCVASELAWRGFDVNKDDLGALSTFFEDNVIAIDKDRYAIKCCKAMLLSSYMKILNIEPSELGVFWQLPRIKYAIHSDLFDARVDKTVSLIVGNPPWGNIDAPNNPIGITVERRSFFKDTKRGHGLIYHDDSDVSIYVVKQCMDQRIFKLAKGVRCGLLIKQQVLTTKANKPFMDWAVDFDLSFVDHGHEVRFRHSPVSRVAECLRGVKIEQKDAVTTETVALCDFIVAANGFQPSRKDVYVEIAEHNPSHSHNKLLYPDKKENTSHLVWKQEDSQEIFFVANGTSFPKGVKITKEQKDLLLSRACLCENYPLSWRGTEKRKFYGEQLETPRLFMPRMPAKNQRLHCCIDLLGEGVGTSGQSIWLKKDSCTLEQLLCICAWANSTSFETSLIQSGVTIRAHGYSLEPNEVAKIRVPKFIFNDGILKLAKRIIQKRNASEKDLQTLDVLCAEAQQQKSA
jgi:hypothetical protein